MKAHPKTTPSQRETLGAVLPAAVALLVLTSTSEGWAFDTLVPEPDGIIDPPSHYQRYRRDEYAAGQPFFQWWYFNVKDLDANRYFAFSYGMLDCVSTPEHENAGILFAMLDRAEGTSFDVLRLMPLDAFAARDDFDLGIDPDPTDGAPRYQLEVIDDDTYRLKGSMAGNPGTIGIGTLRGEPVEADVAVDWDLTIHRVHGWFGQADLEPGLASVGVIAWNTYAHDSEVEGTITVDGTTYRIERTRRYRAYGDGNWGSIFPTGDPPIDFPWAWYSVVAPGDEPAEDLSIIAGTGGLQTGTLFGLGEGRFADIRLPGGAHVGVRDLEVWKPAPDGSGLPVVLTTNDGTVHEYTVLRDDWAPFEDSLGTHLIPLHQQVTITTDSYSVMLDFWSEPDEYFRLLALHEDYVFSDFEGLGVDVHVVVTRQWTETTYEDWDLLHLFPTEQERSEILYDFWSDDGGIEYGYRTDDVVLPERAGDDGEIPPDDPPDGGPAEPDADIDGPSSDGSVDADADHPVDGGEADEPRDGGSDDRTSQLPPSGCSAAGRRARLSPLLGVLLGFPGA